MTDFPSPSGRSKTAKSLAFALFRPVLFAIGAIALALGGLVLTHRSNPEIAALPAPPPAPPAAPPCRRSSWPTPNPRRRSASPSFQGFQMKPPATGRPSPSRRRAIATSSRCASRSGDTIEKMLADIDVPEADRKQIAEKLQALLKKKKLAAGETIELLMQTMPDQPDAPRVLSLSVRPQPEREYIISRQDDGTYDAEEKIYKVSPRIVRVEGERSGSLRAERHRGRARRRRR